MKNSGWRTAGTLIAALLVYELGKLTGALAAQALQAAAEEAWGLYLGAGFDTGAASGAGTAAASGMDGAGAAGFWNGLSQILMQLAAGAAVYLVWGKELGRKEAKGRGQTGQGGKVRGAKRMNSAWKTGGLLLGLSVTSALGLNLLLSLSGLTLLSGSFRETAAVQAAVPAGLGIVLYGIAAPFSEELLFRGIFYRRTREAFGGAVPEGGAFGGAALKGREAGGTGLEGRTFGEAVSEGAAGGRPAENEGAVRARMAAAAASSLMFGIYHGNPVQGIYAFLIGLLLCLVYERTGKLTAAVLFHGAGNLAVYLLIDMAGLGERLSFFGAVGLCALLLGATALCLRLSGLCPDGGKGGRTTEDGAVKKREKGAKRSC